MPHKPLPPKRSLKKVGDLAYTDAISMMYYDVVRLHQRLRVTSTMITGVADKLLEIDGIAKLVEDAEEPVSECGPCNNKRAGFDAV